MVPVFAVATLLGAVGVLAVAFPSHFEVVSSRRSRLGVMGLLGFGLAGLSATFGGWGGAASLGGAVVGALAMLWLAIRYGPSADNGAP